MTYKPIFVVVPIIAVLLGAILLPLSLHPDVAKLTTLQRKF